MNAIQRLFFIALAFVVSLGAAVGIFLYVSLIPYFHTIGWFMAGVVIVGLICVTILMISFTYSRIGIWMARQRTIVHGDVVAYLTTDGKIFHLSAMHEAAKVAQLPAPEVEPQPSDDKTVLELYQKGISLRNICDATGRTYYQVQKITSGKA